MHPCIHYTRMQARERVQRKGGNDSFHPRIAILSRVLLQQQQQQREPRRAKQTRQRLLTSSSGCTCTPSPSLSLSRSLLTNQAKGKSGGGRRVSRVESRMILRRPSFKGEKHAHSVSDARTLLLDSFSSEPLERGDRRFYQASFQTLKRLKEERERTVALCSECQSCASQAQESGGEVSPASHQYPIAILLLDSSQALSHSSV